MEFAMIQPSDERMRRLVEQISAAPGVADQLPSQEGQIVAAALAGASVYDIAGRFGVSEEHVWRIIGAAARSASGTAVAQVETGGLGSDTDPGVTGGYGDTGFGALGNETPDVVPDEPPDE
jgi:hypothetical protein